MFLVQGSVALNSSIFRFLTVPKKNLFKLFAFFSSKEMILSLSTNEIFSEDFILSDNNDFTIT